MYEVYSKQALPDKEYRELLGTAICVFNSNNNFIIENILHLDEQKRHNWNNLIDLESGKLIDVCKAIFGDKTEITTLFAEIVDSRNRIIHGFQITLDNEQMLATKELEKYGGRQFVVTKKYLREFIKNNDTLSTKLHSFRGY